MVNGFQLSIISSNDSILDVCGGLDYASDTVMKLRPEVKYNKNKLTKSKQSKTDAMIKTYRDPP